MSDKEQERLRQLRERQLQARDPLVKQRQFQHNASIKEKRMRKPFSMSAAWKDIPHAIRVPFYFLILGVIIILILTAVWDSPYAFLAGVGVTVVLMIFGVVLGSSLDLRDDIKKHIK